MRTAYRRSPSPAASLEQGCQSVCRSRAQTLPRRGCCRLLMLLNKRKRHQRSRGGLTATLTGGRDVGGALRKKCVTEASEWVSAEVEADLTATVRGRQVVFPIHCLTGEAG